MSRHPSPRERRAAQQWARSLFDLPNFYILDTETSGISDNDEVVQIGVIDKAGTIVIDTLVKPHKQLSQQVIDIHGITNEQLADAPTLSDLYTMLSTRLAGVPLVAYNMDFDWRLLQQTFRLSRLPIFKSGKRHCAMKEYARFRGVHGKRGYKWHKLSSAIRYEQLQVVDAHTALGDVRMTLALMQRMAQNDE